MSSREITEVTLRIAALLEKLGVAYEIGGSLASSLHGVPRSTLDADIVADLTPDTARRFAELLGDEFYKNADAIADAVRARRSFNIIHLPTMLKVDVFAVQDTPFARTEFSRRMQRPFPDAGGPLVWVSSPEDIILHKLVWYADGGKVAQRQLQDAVGVLRTAGATLDQAYLTRWATILSVAELLEQARGETTKTG
ncbi:MAG: hypothetical protein NTW87_02080 [Planctomycetota bacterium]|nr:hypothetical protein [Planctomycetota bacterium]